MPVDGSLARPISAHGWPPRKPYFGRPDGAIGLLSQGELLNAASTSEVPSLKIKDVVGGTGESETLLRKAGGALGSPPGPT